jgi:PIN domain nuclease of toxin-antitoxin system
VEAVAVKALLDTHTVIWAISDDRHLGQAAHTRISAGTAESLAVSDVTLLEVAMLAAKGRIECEAGIVATLEVIVSKVTVLPIDAAIAVEAMELALPHGDPFDRVIVATARRHKLPLLTRDRSIVGSGLVEVVW